MRASIALVLSGLAVQQVSATWDRHAGYFNSPQYNNNECSDKQKGGFDWSDLSDGESNFNYGDFDFGGGWTCANSFGKRDVLSKRTFNNKCIKNKVGKDKPATFSCDKKKDGFSVTEIDVSVEFDSNLEFHYGMPDGSICKHITPCKKEGTTVKNTQCGGATSVDVYLGDHDEQDKEECEIGFHHIGFDCNPGKDYTPPPAYTPPASTPVETPTPSQPVSTAPTCGVYGAPPCDTTTPPVESSTPPSETPTPTPSCGAYGAPPCESSTPPVESSTPSPSCGGYGAPPCESSPPPVESSTPPPETTPSCGVYGAPPCESSTPPVESSTAPPETPSASCGVYGAPPCESSTPPVESSATPSPSCGAYGAPPCESSTPAESSTKPVETPTPPPSCGEYGAPPCESSTPPVQPSSPPAESTTPAPSCGAYGAPPCDTATPPSETPSPSQPGSTAPSCGAYGAPPCESSTPPVESSAAPSSPPPETSEVPSSTGPACGSYGAPPCETTTPEVSPSGGYSAPPETPLGTAPSTPESPSPSPSSPGTYVPPGGYSPPEVLPKCLNTWIQIDTQCKDNTDSSCYCKIPGFTDHVIECVAAHGSQEESQQALQYFVGICASDVPQNPGIITNCPSYIPLNPTTPPAAEPTPSAPGATGPVPSAPAPSAPAPSAPAPSAPVPSPAPSAPAVTEVPCTTITYGTTSVTVPKVVFTTETPGAPGANPTEPIALMPGTTPPPAVASTTGAPYPIPSSFGTITVPAGTTGLTPSNLPEFTGAASPLNVQVKGALFGAVLAFLAL